MKRILFSLALVALCVTVAMKAGAANPEVKLLYPMDTVGVASENIPKMWIYLPEKDKATGQAVLIFPGGGYRRLAMDHEGHDVAKWLNAQGIAAVIVKYRMPNGDPMRPIGDARTAMQYARDNSKAWGVSKVGVIGFSAGGHLASTVTTHFRDLCRPDFSILIYPVVTMHEEYAHMGSRTALIGPKYYKELVDLYSNEQQVYDNTPPTFLALSDDDLVVLPQNSVDFYRAMKKFNRPAEMHIYPTGGHGWGWKISFTYRDEFLTSLSRWLKEQNK